MTIICEECGKSRIVSDCRARLKYCSVSCWVESRKLDPDVIERMARMYKGNRRRVAEILDIPYPTFYNKLRKQGLNNLFMRRGGGYGTES